jgi:peptidyl-prolyl cis-trans isomerase D
MITVIRKQLKTTLLQSIVWFFVIVFCIFFMLPDTLNRIQSPEWVAIVNNTKIEYPEFARILYKYESNVRLIREQYGSYADMFIKMLGLGGDFKKTAFDEIVRETVLNDVAKQIPVYIADEYIEKIINNPHLAQSAGVFELLPLGFFNQNGLDQKALDLYLSRNHMNMRQFEDIVEQALARHMVVQLASLGAYTPSFMVNSAVRNELLLRDYAILTFSLDKIKAEESSKSITDDQLRAFFDAKNRASKLYWVPEMRSAVIWTFNPEDYGISIDDSAIEEYYEKHRINKYVEYPSKVQIRRILFKLNENESKDQVLARAKNVHDELIQNPMSFEAMARQYSDDKESASKGGLLEFFSKGQRDKLVERKAFMLSKNGDISDVFESADGYEIIQRVDKKAAQCKPLDHVKNEIKALLLNQAFSREFNRDVKKLLHHDGNNYELLHAFAKDKGGHFTEVSCAQKDDSKSMQSLFKFKHVNDVDYYIDNNVGHLMVFKEIKHKHEPEFQAVKTRVKEDFVNEQAQNTLAERLKEASKSLKQSEKPEDVAHRLGAALKRTGLISKNNAEKTKELQSENIPMVKMFQLENKGAIAADMQKNGYVFFVAEVAEADSQEEQKKKEEVTMMLNNEVMTLAMQGFVASLSRNAKIETNESLLNQIETQAL